MALANSKGAQGIFSKVKFLKLEKKSLILDIGSNDGMLLSKFKKYGFKCLGIEPAKKIAKVANDRNIKTINSFFDNKTTNLILKKYKNNYSIYSLKNILSFLIGCFTV